MPNPSLSPAGGAYNTPQSVTITGASGAEIHYTTNGVDPTTSDPVIASGGTVSVGMPMTVKARAWMTGWTPSGVTAASFNFQVAVPALSPGSGSYVGSLPVSVSTITTGATLRYRTDGAEPTESDPVVTSGALTVEQSGTIRVKGFLSGWVPSSSAEGTYWINQGTAASPTLSPAPGTFTAAQTVTLTTSITGGLIRYTTDGTEPGFDSPGYAAPVSVTATTVLKARAFGPDMTGSASAGGLYRIDLGTVDPPRFSPGAGTYPTTRVVTLASETSGAFIHYRLDGVDPTQADPALTSGSTLVIDQNAHLKARAYKAGTPASVVRAAEYRVTGGAAVGANHTVALKADGTVWTWGRNDFGAFGDPLAAGGEVRTVPRRVGGIADVVAVAAGTSHTIALKRDGTVWAWGRNAQGEVGDGTATQRDAPVQALALSDVVAIASGSSHGLALKRDGTVWAWGSDGVRAYGSTPQQMTGVRGAVSVAAGTNFSFALQSDGLASGTLWSWGKNQTGTLGDGTTLDRTSPVAVLQAVTRMSGGNFHAFAVKSSGDLFSWGLNNASQLGASGADRSRPAAVAGMTSVTLTSAGPHFGLAGKADGTVWCWGDNGWGKLGDGTGVQTRPSPVQTGVSSPLTLSASGTGSHGAAVRADGTLSTWGKNDVGALGDGTTVTNATPKPVPNFMLVSSDTDRDGLTAAEEAQLGTDPNNADTNGDGVLDGAADDVGLSATNTDMDLDGVTNSVERTAGRIPSRRTPTTTVWPTGPTAGRSIRRVPRARLIRLTRPLRRSRWTSRSARYPSHKPLWPTNDPRNPARAVHPSLPSFAINHLRVLDARRQSLEQKRRHSTVGYASPAEHERRYAGTHRAPVLA